MSSARIYGSGARGRNAIERFAGTREKEVCGNERERGLRERESKRSAGTRKKELDRMRPRGGERGDERNVASERAKGARAGWKRKRERESASESKK
eukprot:2813449-Pleurochrysis_carterae.AAC.1